MENRMNKKYLAAITTAILLSVTPSAYAEEVDQYGVDLEYKPGYEKQGCDASAWSQLKANYISTVNTDTAITERMDKAMIERARNPNNYGWKDCMGDASQVFDKAMEIWNSDFKIKDIGQSFDLGKLADGVMKKIGEKVKNAACQAVKKAVNQALNRTGITELTSEAGAFAKDPFGYASKQVANKTGFNPQNVGSEIDNAINKEFSKAIK
jgi:hypothetical protein